MVRFLLNDKEHKLGQINPNMSVLDFLRLELGKVGTKEGCASGDCGACTVVLGELAGDSLCYSAINSCITPVGNLHGKQLITIEALKEGNSLHPSQQAMVDCHGSQCGFCTPGFVMSMFAYRKSNSLADRDSILEALGGNLCRCTGYRPIIDAALRMYDPAPSDQFTKTEAATVSCLREITNSPAAVHLSSGGKNYFSPTSSEELASLLTEHPDAKLVAGGTDLSLEITQFLREFETLIHTGRVRELLNIQQSPKAIEIGAAVTYNDCKSLLCTEYPDLEELFDRLGSRQIRNQGTVGGNLGNASPIGDMPPVLIALNAQLVLRSSAGSRTIPVEEYFISYKVTSQRPGEFIESIILPRAKKDQWFRAYKISKRLEDDISTICGVFCLEIDDDIVSNVSIAFGGMAEIPKRATGCEMALRGNTWTQETVSVAMTQLANDFSPIDDFRASARYRQQVSQNLLQRLYLETQGPDEALRVTHYA